MRILAVSVASFLTLLGFEMGRLHGGHDPALAQSRAATVQGTSQDSGPAATSRPDTTQPEQGGSDIYDYYTPSSSDPPTTGSS